MQFGQSYPLHSGTEQFLLSASKEIELFVKRLLTQWGRGEGTVTGPHSNPARNRLCNPTGSCAEN